MADDWLHLAVAFLLGYLFAGLVILSDWHKHRRRTDDG